LKIYFVQYPLFVIVIVFEFELHLLTATFPKL